MILYNFMAWVNGGKCLCFVSADSRDQAQSIIAEMYRDTTAYHFGTGIGDYEDELFRDSHWFTHPGYSTWVPFELTESTNLPHNGNATDAFFKLATMLPYYTRQEKIDQLVGNI